MATYLGRPDKVTYFAETDYRSKRIRFGIRDEDRERHMYVIGKTGMGKSTLLENLAIQDIQNGEGLCFIDPHGGTAEALLSYVPEHRVNDVIYFAPFDREFPVALNVMEDIGRDKRALVASGLIGAFKKVWVDAWSARMEYILSNALLALLEYPGATLLGVNRMFADKNYRSLIVNNITDPSVKAFWVDEYAKYSDKFATEATAAIQNKVGQFAANPIIRNMIGQPKSTFDIRNVMDERKILIVNLSKGRMGEGNANLVGSMLITKIYLAAMSRADVGAEVVRGLPPFYLYVDEFQSFANESFADILSEARKYKLSLTVAHQYIEQMSDEVRAAVFGNVGSMISFRVGAYDAEVLEKEFAPAFTAEDMVNLGFAQVYLRLMIKGVGSSPFSAKTLDRPKMPARAFVDEVIAASRRQFARPRADVEEEIRKWHDPVPEPPRPAFSAATQVPETRKYPPGMRPIRPVRLPTVEQGQNVVPRSAPPSSLRESIAAIRPPVLERPSGLERHESGASARLMRGVKMHREDHGTSDSARPLATPPPPPSPPPSAPQDRPLMSEGGVPPVAPNDQRVATSTPTVPTHQPFGVEFEKLRVDAPAVSAAAIPDVKEAVGPREPDHQTKRMDVRVMPERMESPRPAPARAVTQEMKTPATPSGVRPQPPIPNTRASLSMLKSQPKKDKGPSTENLSSLKALIGAAFEAPVSPKASPSVAENGERPQAQQRESNLSRKELPPRAQAPLLENPLSHTALPPHEVPEDVLRGVLAD